jgi:hypothetical protein
MNRFRLLAVWSVKRPGIPVPLVKVTFTVVFVEVLIIRQRNEMWANPFRVPGARWQG